MVPEKESEQLFLQTLFFGEEGGRVSATKKRRG